MASLCASSSAVAAVARSHKNGGAAVAVTNASFLGGRKLRQGKWAARAPTARRAVSVSAAAATERPLWFPGSTPPPWLDGRLSPPTEQGLEKHMMQST